MLHNINSYGLSHLCAFSFFELDEESIADQFADRSDKAFSYPYLDINFKNDWANQKHHVEFYSRGNKYYKTSFNNLFEYHIFNEQSGYKHWKKFLAE